LCFSDEVREAWDSRKSLQANLRHMGLSVDPNKTLRIPTAKVSTVNYLTIEVKFGSLEVSVEIQRP